ncbi:amino acid-binding protein [Propionibacteriaceae bacterium Y2011]
MRVSLPDRPGALGLVAGAVGAAGADIVSVEVVARGDGEVIDDFVVTLPPDAYPDTIVSACQQLAGVQVVWISRYPEGGGLQSDIEALELMSHDPENAAETLASQSVQVFHVHWAMVVRPEPEPAVTFATPQAPPLGSALLRTLEPWGEVHSQEVQLPDWGGQIVAIAPLRDGRVVVIGRQGGPPFLASELARFGHLAALAR